METNGGITTTIGEDNLQLIDFLEEDDFLIAVPFRDSLEDLRLSVSFDTVNGCDHTKRFRCGNSQVVERIDQVQSESMEPRRLSFLRKSLAWDSAFFTSAGVLNPEELFLINKGFKRAESNQPSDGFHLETLEGDLFKYVKPNNIHKLGKRSKVGTNIGGSAFGQPNSLSCNKTEICSQNKVKLLRAPKSQSLNPQGSKGMTKTSINDPHVIQDKVSSQPKLTSSRQTTKGAVEGSDGTEMENKTRKAGLGSDLSVSKRSRWGDSSGLPKSTSFTSPKSTEKDSKLHRSLDSSSSASSSKPLRRKTNPRSTKLPASASSVHFSLTSISSSSATFPATSIDGCFSESLSSNSTTHQNPATNFHNAMLASDFQNHPLTPSQKLEERKFATIPFSGGPKRKIKPSGLRLPSPKIGFFDEEQPLQPNFRRITQVEFEGQSPSPNENRLNKLRSSNLSPRVSSENCSRMRRSFNGEHDGRKVSASCSKVKEISKKKMKVKDEGMKKKQVEEGQKENVCSFEDEVNGLSRELEVIDLDRDSEVKVHGQLSLGGTPDHCSRTPLIEKTFGVKTKTRMKLKYSVSRFTNTASSPILIGSDDDDQFPVSNNHVMEGCKIDNSDHPSGEENETAGTHLDEVKPYLHEKLEIHTGVESLLEDLTMEDKETIRGSRKVLADIATENVNRQSTVAPQAFTESISMDDELLQELVLLEGSSNRCSGSKATIQNLNEEFNEKVVVAKIDTPTEWKVDKMAKEENGKKRKLPRDEYGDDEKMEVKYNTIRTRTSPRTLYETVIGLSENQKDALYELGLGSIANMTTDGVPDKLAYYVVDALDPSNMYLKVNTGVILVTIQSIHELLGLPIGGVDLIEAIDTPFGLNLVKDWKQQFQKANVRPSDVSRLILKSDSSGFMFKVNFLVLFTNLMVDCNSSGTCNFSFLSRIENEQMLSNIDWCEYLYERLRTSKEKWKPDNPECFYSGPLTYLMLLYVNATISKRVFVSSRVSSQSPAITVWNIGLLRKRQTTEIEDGGFGLLPIKDSYMQKIQNPKSESTKSPSTPPMEPSKEDYAHYMDEKMKMLLQAKMEAEKILETAVSKYPEDGLFDKYKNELDNLFNIKRWFPANIGEVHAPHSKGKSKLDDTVTTTPLSNTSLFDECWNSPGFVAEANAAVDREVERSEKRKSAKKLRMPDFTIDPPSFDLGISPEKKPPDPTDMGDEESIPTEPKPTGNVAYTKVNRKKAELIPQETYGLRETRRSIKLGDHLCSPFVRRTVDFNPTAKEKRVHEWALASFGLRCDQVFNNKDGVWIIRAGIESLAAHTACYTSVLDAWASLLNYEERCKNRDSPRRYFFNTDILGNMHMRTRPTNISNMYPSFKKNLSFSAKNNKDIIRLKDIDLAFFPIIKHDHFYVIVFNFKNPSMTIIDSEKNVPVDTDAMIRNYGYTPEILHMLLVQHLGTVGHPLAHTLKELEPERLTMDWQRGNVFDESAVFTMRFMETYMGQQRTWKPGFETNAARQVSQISDLRAKYVAKLLYSPCNSKKEYVEKQVQRYFTIDQSIRFDMLEQARITRWERLNPYYYPK